MGPATRSASSMCCTCRHDRQLHSSSNLIDAPHPPPFPLSSPPACAGPLQVLYGRSGYLLGCLLLNSQLQPGSVPQEAMQSVVEAIIASGEPSCLPQALPHLGPSLPTASCSCITCAALEEPKERCAGRSLAVHLRSPATFPTPLFYLWPPGPDASPYLGAAHGLMGEPACQFAAALLSCPALLCSAAGRRSAAGTPGCASVLFYFWHAKPYLGAAHGMIGGWVVGWPKAGQLCCSDQPSHRGSKYLPTVCLRCHCHCICSLLAGLLQASCTLCCTCQPCWRRCQGRSGTCRQRCSTFSPWSAMQRAGQASRRAGGRSKMLAS